METTEDIVLLLNEMLNVEQLDHDLLEHSMSIFNEICNSRNLFDYDFLKRLDSSIHSRIILLDFEAHSDQNRINARFWKMRNTRIVNYELAYNMRELEKECQRYLDFKKQYGLEKSSFVLLKDYLIYANFGTAKNDHLVKEFITKEQGYKNLKIEYLIQYLNQ